MKKVGVILGVFIACAIGLLTAIVFLVIHKYYLWALTLGVIFGFLGYVLIRFIILLRKQVKSEKKYKGEV